MNGLRHAHDVLGGGDVGEDLLDARLDLAAEVTPASAWTTIWSVSPDFCGKSAFSVFETCCDSDPGWR